MGGQEGQEGQHAREPAGQEGRRASGQEGGQTRSRPAGRGHSVRRDASPGHWTAASGGKVLPSAAPCEPQSDPNLAREQLCLPRMRQPRLANGRESLLTHTSAHAQPGPGARRAVVRRAARNAEQRAEHNCASLSSAEPLPVCCQMCLK